MGYGTRRALLGPAVGSRSCARELMGSRYTTDVVALQCYGTHRTLLRQSSDSTHDSPCTTEVVVGQHSRLAVHC
jgi:hypothetical protein